MEFLNKSATKDSDFHGKKHEERKQKAADSKKETVYHYGGQTWTMDRVYSTIKKSKVSEAEIAAFGR